MKRSKKQLAIAAWIVAATTSASAQVDSPPMAPPVTFGLASSDAIAKMERRLSDVDAEIADGKKELEAVAPARAAADRRIHARGRMLYKLVRAGLMPLSGGFPAFVEHAQRVERLKRALAKDVVEANQWVERGAKLAGRLDELAKERTELAERKGLAEAAKIAIDEERRRREAFERAFATSIGAKTIAPTSDEVVIYGPSGTPSESLDPASFKAKKGRLLFPVAGKAETHRVTKEGGPSLEIVATLGAPVRAVHNARVAFADRYGSYGSLVILDHGERWYTVSGNLATIDVKVGDEVSAGEKIGTVGDDGRGPAISFEIRHGNEKVAAEAWFGL